MADITDDMATVTLSLLCEVNYTIIAGGLLAGDLVGPYSSHETFMGVPCPIVMTTVSSSM